MSNISNKEFVISKDNVAEYADKIGSWIKNLVEQSNRKGVILGMSGGVDCSVVARLCKHAGVHVQLVLMPYGEDMAKTKHLNDAMELIERFDFSYRIFNIQPAVDALDASETPFYQNASTANKELSTANLRPRIRMTYLYQIAQLGDFFVVGTGNLSERTVGYFTKWGDGACDFNPIAMLTKQEVYLLAKYLNVPDSIINKKPSAGLWEGQTDEAELGMTYAQIDAFILQGTSGDPAIDEQITKRSQQSAHKLRPIPIYQ